MSQTQHWQRVYQTKSDNEVSWFQQNPVLSLKLIKQAMANRALPKPNIIDVGCGTSTLVDELLKSGDVRITLTDLSSAALEKVALRLAGGAQQVTFQAGNICQFQSSDKFDIWHDRAVFHFLTEVEKRKQYLQVLDAQTHVESDIFIATFAPDGPTKCSGLPIEQYDAEKISKVLGDNYQLIEVYSEIHQTPFATEQSFNYFHFNKRKEQ